MYIDGFVIAVPTANRAAFLDHARRIDPMFLEFGATRVVEGVGRRRARRHDDRLSAARWQATDDETVVFAWIEWPDKATRDAGMARMRTDPRMADGRAPAVRRQADDLRRLRRR